MTDSWEDWGIVEANDWLMAHSDDSGDPKIRRACEEIVKDTHGDAQRERPPFPTADA
jgi:hypothetical protein